MELRLGHAEGRRRLAPTATGESDLLVARSTHAATYDKGVPHEGRPTGRATHEGCPLTCSARRSSTDVPPRGPTNACIHSGRPLAVCRCARTTWHESDSQGNDGFKPEIGSPTSVVLIGGKHTLIAPVDLGLRGHVPVPTSQPPLEGRVDFEPTARPRSSGTIKQPPTGRSRRVAVVQSSPAEESACPSYRTELLTDAHHPWLIFDMP